MASSASCSAASIAPLIALNCAGRLSVSVATPPASSRSRIGVIGSFGAFIVFLEDFLGTAGFASLDRARRTRPFAQHEFLDLAGRRFRQLAEHDSLGCLE